MKSYFFLLLTISLTNSYSYSYLSDTEETNENQMEQKTDTLYKCKITLTCKCDFQRPVQVEIEANFSGADSAAARKQATDNYCSGQDKATLACQNMNAGVNCFSTGGKVSSCNTIEKAAAN